MKFVYIAILMLFTAATCKNKQAALPENCYKGRLEIKALCMNYTISVQQGSIDSVLFQPSWTDETTGKTYTNVFGLDSKCNFPSDIKEGDTFYFAIDNTVKQDCAVCLAYYPVPQKKLSIKVLSGPCQ